MSDWIVEGVHVLVNSDTAEVAGRRVRGERARVVSTADRGLVPEWVCVCVGHCTNNPHSITCWNVVALRPDEVHLIPEGASA